MARNTALNGMFILEQAPSSLTSLDVAERTLIQQANGSEAPRTLSMTKLLKGLSSLRSLSCPVRTTFAVCLLLTACFPCSLRRQCQGYQTHELGA